jgi:hypothetical protein
MRLLFTVKNSIKNRQYIIVSDADAKQLYREIIFSPATEKLKTPDMMVFDDEGDCIDAPNVLVIPIRATLVTAHCKKRIYPNRTYSAETTHRWFRAADKSAQVCAIYLNM